MSKKKDSPYSAQYSNFILNTDTQQAPVPGIKADPKYKNPRNPSVTVALRIRKDDLDKLTGHLKAKGYLSTSQGIRAIIQDYMLKIPNNQ